MQNFIIRLNSVIWGVPALILILGVGMYLTLQLRFVQITMLSQATRCFLRKLFPGKMSGDRSSFRALCTALAATVGTGNLVGVAGAICLGGPGAVFWMWLSGILGMVTKYTEALLAVRYRVRSEHGFLGGPMYIIRLALPGKLHFLAWIYGFFGMLASFGVGNATQINAAMTGLRCCFQAYGWELTSAEQLFMTTAMAFLIAVVLFGGTRYIGATAERLVPFAAAGYILMCLGVLIARWQQIPAAFCKILQGAFSPKAVTGGMIGSAFLALRVGCSRGVFTNEAGMGTAAIAHAGAEGVHPAEQGLMGIMEVFLDTIVICTLTALVILVSGVPIAYGADVGGNLTVLAFSTLYGHWAVPLITVSMILFAMATVLGWGFYGTRCTQFLFGQKANRHFAALQVIAVFAGAFLETSVIWQLSEVLNGLMAIPNLITLAVLAPEAVRLTKEYKKSGV